MATQRMSLFGEKPNYEAALNERLKRLPDILAVQQQEKERAQNLDLAERQLKLQKKSLKQEEGQEKITSLVKLGGLAASVGTSKFGREILGGGAKKGWDLLTQGGGDKAETISSPYMAMSKIKAAGGAGAGIRAATKPGILSNLKMSNTLLPGGIGLASGFLSKKAGIKSPWARIGLGAGLGMLGTGLSSYLSGGGFFDAGAKGFLTSGLFGGGGSLLGGLF